MAEAKKLEKFPESKPILPDTEDFDQLVHYTKKWSFKIIFSIFKKNNWDFIRWKCSLSIGLRTYI